MTDRAKAQAVVDEIRELAAAGVTDLRRDEVEAIIAKHGASALRQCVGCGQLTEELWPRMCEKCEVRIDEERGDNRVAFPQFCSFPALMLGYLGNR
jgi:hypothetical protein